jgi:hypothetical protein
MKRSESRYEEKGSEVVIGKKILVGFLHDLSKMALLPLSH